MRITTWNCLQGTDRKIRVLFERLQPDIAIVPESAQSPAVTAGSLLEGAVPHAWTGEWPNKGLGIFAPTAERLDVGTPSSSSGARHGLAVRAELPDDTATVLGVWTLPHPGGPWPSPYMNAADRILADHEALLVDGDTIVAGDFNASARTSPEAFPAFLELLADRYGLRSAYHVCTGAEFGGEPDATLWWRKNEVDAYHCDLILVPESWEIEDVTVGTHAEWGDRTLPLSSDHAPVTAVLRRR